MQMDINNDGTVDWEEISSFMVEVGMRSWSQKGIGMPIYPYVGQVDSAQPGQVADQVRAGVEFEIIRRHV